MSNNCEKLQEEALQHGGGKMDKLRKHSEECDSCGKTIDTIDLFNNVVENIDFSLKSDQKASINSALKYRKMHRQITGFYKLIVPIAAMLVIVGLSIRMFEKNMNNTPIEKVIIPAEKNEKSLEWSMSFRKTRSRLNDFIKRRKPYSSDLASKNPIFMRHFGSIKNKLKKKILYESKRVKNYNRRSGVYEEV